MFLYRRIAAHIAAAVLLARSPACGQVASSSNNCPYTSPAIRHGHGNHSLPLTTAATASATPVEKLINVCALITPAEAAATLGTDAAKLQTQVGTSKVESCRFRSARSAPITLIVHQYGDANGASRALQIAVDRAKKQSTFLVSCVLHLVRLYSSTVAAVARHARRRDLL
jgi:hypothetical protein